MKIKEVIIVEGLSDKNYLSGFLDADIISCNGSAIDGFDIEFAKKLANNQGIIILTDPDFPGKKIRDYLQNNIKNAKHAFIKKEHSIRGNKVGVAECLKEEILRALENVVTFKEDSPNQLVIADLYILGLTGNADSKQNRLNVCNAFNIGYCNAKTMLKRLNMIDVTYDMVKGAI